jgi:hypothetical protein
VIQQAKKQHAQQQQHMVPSSNIEFLDERESMLHASGKSQSSIQQQTFNSGTFDSSASLKQMLNAS